MKRIVYDAEAFIAALTQHIPDRSFQMLRYYGFYSNKSRGLREKERKRMKKE
ncbi:MAG: IS91 family transposase, partial [Deltaproteobacteria bacterium]|nr:IS91 family transposase [Deltaproteobacteria bacterium]